MKAGIFRASLIFCLIFLPVSSHSDEISKEAGSTGVRGEIKETAMTAGEGLRKGGREMIRGFKQAGRKTVGAAKEVGKASREGLGHAGEQMKEDMKGLKKDQVPAGR